MTITFLYKFVGEHATSVEGYIRELKSRCPGAETASVDINTRDGADMARLYDAVNYPTILALREDGQLAQIWHGLPLPLIDEVASFAIQ